MPYGTRIVCALVGGMLFVAGLVTAFDAIGGGGEVTAPAAASGLGLGLLATAFLRRD